MREGHHDERGPPLFTFYGRPTTMVPTFGALVAALVIVGLALFVTARDNELSATSGSDSSAPVTTTASTATTVPNAKNEVVARLREILQIRERASKPIVELFIRRVKIHARQRRILSRLCHAEQSLLVCWNRPRHRFCLTRDVQCKCHRRDLRPSR